MLLWDRALAETVPHLCPKNFELTVLHDTTNVYTCYPFRRHSFPSQSY